MTFNKTLSLVALAGLATAAVAQTDIDWVGGDSNWNNAANWDPMNVPNATDENALVGSNSEVSLDVSVSINALRVFNGTTLTFNAGRSIGVIGGVVNSGVISLNPTTSGLDSVLDFNASGDLTGGGFLILEGGDNDARLQTSNATITNNGGHVIMGAGEIRASLINDSLVVASDTGLGNRLTLNTENKTNNSIFQADGGAELFISSITLTQGPAGQIQSEAGGAVLLSGNNTISGGRLVGPGPFTRLSGGTTNLSDVSLETDLIADIVTNIFYNSPAFNCSGRITLNDSTSGNDAVLRFNDNTVVSGGGSVFLAGGSNDSRIETDGTTVTFAPGFTVEGSGQITAQLINDGLIRAFPGANNDGRLLLNGSGKTNNGVMRADTGGTLEITGTTVVQNAEGGSEGEILADGGAVEFTGNQTIQGGTIRTVNGGTATRTNSGTLTLIDTALDGDLDVGIVANVFYSGDTFNCTGTMTLNETDNGNNAVLRFDTDSTITGGGRVFLAGSSNDSQVTTNEATLTVAPDFTIEGSGEVGAAMINNGLVRTALGDFADGRLRLVTNDKTNNAVMSAETDGILEVNGVTITQGATGVLLADGGALSFAGGSQTVTGGTIRTQNGGTATRETSGTLSLNSVAIDGDLAVDIIANVFWTGPVLDCNGSIILNNSGNANNAQLRFDSDATATGGGRIFLAGGSDDSQVNTDGTTLTVGSDFTVEGSGVVNATMVNEGLVRAFPSEFGDGRLILRTGLKTNNGLMVGDSGGVLEFQNAVVVQNAEGSLPGTLFAADGGIVEFTGNGSIDGGVLDSSGSGRLIFRQNGNTTLADATINGDIEIDQLANIFVTSLGLENNATIRINPSGAANDGTIRFDADTVVTGDGAFALEGSSNDSQINTNGTTATFGPGQRIEGEGQMNGSFVVNGTLAPGLPIGDITGSSSIAFGGSAVFQTITNGVGSGGRLALAGGSVDLGGSVQVQLTYVPAVNDQFNIITAPVVNGLFDDVAVTIGTLPTNIDVRLVYTPTTVDVKFVCLADLAPPFGVLDLSDVTGFTGAFLAQDPLADLAEPIGIFDLLDINAFISNFLTGCN